MVSIIILAIQIVSLLASEHLVHRLPRRATRTAATRSSNAAHVVIPHSFINMLYQSTIAILLLVGFESVTALGAEAIHPEKDIKRGVLISLAIQGGICYLIQYFAANFAVGAATISSGTGPEPAHRLRRRRSRLRADRDDAEDVDRNRAEPGSRSSSR